MPWICCEIIKGKELRRHNSAERRIDAGDSPVHLSDLRKAGVESEAKQSYIKY